MWLNPKREEDRNRTGDDHMCEHEYEWNNYCGAHVCVRCGDHKGMVQCFCGWTKHGGKPDLDDVEDW